MIDIALFGAGGKMGIRLTKSIKDDPEYALRYVEPSAAGVARLADQGVTPTPPEQALAGARVVILAVPDSIVGTVAADVVPHMASGALLMTLDPAGARAGRLPHREDIAYFVTHPSHPPLFDLFREQTPEARRDFWGGGLATQALVCAMPHGKESDYTIGEEIAKRIFRPISRSHRITVEQMALLEPAMSESITTTLVMAMRETIEEGIARGLPRDAAYDFMLGHIQIQLALIFDQLDWQMSDAAKQAAAEARDRIFRPDWMRLMDEDEIEASVKRITGG